MLNLYECTRHPTIFKEIFEQLVDQFYLECSSEDKQPINKLWTDSKGLFETYLQEIKKFKTLYNDGKISFIWPQINYRARKAKSVTKELRFCPMCPSKMEDEIHFILEYQCYSQFQKPSLHYSNHKLKTTITSKNSLEDVDRFIDNKTKLRI